MRSTWAALGVAVFLASFGNLQLWGALAFGPGALSWLALAATYVALVAVLDLLMQAVAIPWLFKPVASTLLVFSAITTYFMLEYGVLIDVGMVRNTLQTDVSEARDLLTFRAVAHIAALGVLPALVLAVARIRYRPVRAELALRAKVVTVSLALGFFAVWPAYKELSIAVLGNRALKQMANPLSPLVAVVKGIRREGAAKPLTLERIAGDARRGAAASGVGGKRRVVVLVVGETATASHFALNGYPRDTNPELTARSVLNFPRVHSCGTSTAESVPCMFSSLAREDYSRGGASGRENLLDVLQRVGITVLWRDNNSGCKGVCGRVPFEQIDGPEALRYGNEFLDEALLAGLQEHLDRSDGDLFIVLHQKGSHGPAYFRRSPPAFKRFLPECSLLDLQDCRRDDLVNAYDNTILYTDHVLARVIDFLAANSAEAQVAMLYVSDHGESLGENGIYLHGFPYWLAPDEQTHVPMVFWASPEFLTGQGVQPAELPSLAAQERSHDNLFHTVLGFFDIETAVYEPDLDIFAEPQPDRVP